MLNKRETALYVAVTRANAIWRIELDDPARRAGLFTQLFAAGPDGVALDDDGNLVVAHPTIGAVWLFSRIGEPLYYIKSNAKEMTTNIAFGGAGNKTLYITEFAVRQHSCRASCRSRASGCTPIPDMLQDAAAIRLTGVAVRFGTYTAVRDVDIAVRAGEFVGLVGPTGCGKSTLLNVITGLAHPFAGTVEIFGRRLAGINQKVGYMLQQDGLAAVEDHARQRGDGPDLPGHEAA